MLAWVCFAVADLTVQKLWETELQFLGSKIYGERGKKVTLIKFLYYSCSIKFINCNPFSHPLLLI